MKKMYKVWYRQIYCETITGWVREMVWVHVVMPLFRRDIDEIRCTSCCCNQPIPDCEPQVKA